MPAPSGAEVGPAQLTVGRKDNPGGGLTSAKHQLCLSRDGVIPTGLMVGMDISKAGRFISAQCISVPIWRNKTGSYTRLASRAEETRPDERRKTELQPGLD